MIDLNGIKLKNRFIIAAGPWSFYWKIWPFLNPGIFGAFTTNTFTLEPREGNLEFIKLLDKKIFPKIWKVLRKIPNGWINSSGWRNPGIEWAIKEFYPDLRKAKANIIFSIGGFCIEDYVILIETLNSLELAAIELNISCPNVKFFSKDFKVLKELFSKAKKCSKHPLIVKIGINDLFYLEVVGCAEEVGINAVNAINTIEEFHPGLKNRRGGMGGRRIKPISLEIVKKLKLVFGLPVIATGGIYFIEDCQDFFKRGADAVSFGSVFLSRPWLPQSILKKVQSRA